MPKPLFKSEIPVQSLVTITQTAVSCGIGLLLASKLRRNAQRNTAVAMLSVGALSTLPLVFEVLSRRWLGPTTERGMRRTLESIREDSGFSDEAEVV
jgi:hypothetical protein